MKLKTDFKGLKKRSYVFPIFENIKKRQTGQNYNFTDRSCNCLPLARKPNGLDSRVRKKTGLNLKKPTSEPNIKMHLKRKPFKRREPDSFHIM